MLGHKESDTTERLNSTEWILPEKLLISCSRSHFLFPSFFLHFSIRLFCKEVLSHLHFIHIFNHTSFVMESWITVANFLPAETIGSSFFFF